MKTWLLSCAMVMGGFGAGLGACGDDPAASTDTAPDGDTSDTPDTSPDTSADAPDDADADTDTVAPLPPDLAVVPAPGEVVAGVSVKASDLVWGPKAEGQLGDFILANHKARFLIEGLRRCGGYRQYGGNLVDADLQPGGEDRMGELWLVWNLRVFKPDRAEVVSDGRDGTAIVRFSGRTTSYAWIDALVGDTLLADPVDLAVTYEYRLAPDSNVLELRVTLTNDGAAYSEVQLPILAMNMGDGAPAFTPGPGLATLPSGSVVPWTGGVGLVRAHGFLPPAGQVPIALFQETNVQISLMTAFGLDPGASETLVFHHIVGDEGTTSVERARVSHRGATLATLRGAVTGESGWADGEGIPAYTGSRSWVAVRREADVVALTPVRPDGTWEALVEPGDVSVQAFAPGRGASELALATATLASPTTVDLELPALGEVIARVTDGAGAPLPAQITFFRQGETPSPFAPEPVRFDPDWGDGRSAVAFHIPVLPDQGPATTHLLPGTYRVVASRGYSWELDEATITVQPGTTQSLDFTLTRAVDDDGWSAADLHIHSFWSPDSEVPYPVRLHQAAANDVALPVFTEHTYMGDIQTPLAQSGVSDWVSPVPGQEVSTVEYGHFNAYPLVYDATAPSGGAVFEHGWAGTGLFDQIRAQHDGDIIVQVNHPRSGAPIKSYFNAVGFDATLMTVTKPARWTLDWDVLEAFNTRCLGDAGNAETVQDWFDMNDHGVRKALGSGSDSHSEAAGVGHPRTWVHVDRAVVAADVEALVPVLRRREAFVSCGPFVHFTATDGTPIGGRTTLDEGAARFRVRVEAPSWIAIDEVRLLENGVPVQTVALADWVRPGDLAPTVRFDGQLSAVPRADAWYILEVVGSGGLWPLKPNETPYAMTNPIEIDADGDGAWTPPAETGTTRPKSARRVPAELPHRDDHGEPPGARAHRH